MRVNKRLRFVLKLSGRISLAPLAIEQATDIDVAHDIDGRAAAVQEPIDGQEDGDILGRQSDRVKHQGHRHQTGLGDPGRSYRGDDAGQHHHKLLRKA